MRPDWDSYFLAVAKVISTRSTCSSRPVGCVITRGSRILSTGYNGAPSGYDHCIDRSTSSSIYCLRRDRGVSNDNKWDVCPSIHAEENAVKFAESNGISLAGSTVYTTLSPCLKCIRKLKEHDVDIIVYEHLYQTLDKEKDDLWMQEARDSFHQVRQHSIGNEPMQQILNALTFITSQRKLESQ